MIGKTISHYKILEELGRSGIGVVYKAEDTRLKRTVALKFLPKETTHDPDARRRFIQEAQAAAALDHPNICTIHEIDEAEDRTFIAMAYIEGQTLKEKIHQGPLEVEQAVDIVIQVAEGLQEAHERGIVHRDIKPANIMLTGRGQARIMDFGLAKLVWSAGLTRTAAVMGTAAYMSPEQARGETVDLRTDIWALGVVLYEMLTGKFPFKGGTEQAAFYSILYDDPEPMADLENDIRGEFQQLIQKALSKQPDDRYKNMGELLVELKSIKKILEAKREAAFEETDEPLPSIAVLPFLDLSPQKDQEYFCDGIAEELINALTRIEDLRVVARTSAFSFKGKEVDIREIGKKLSVKTLLEGSVRKAGKRIRVTAQLINVADGYHLWSERYDRDLEDIFAIQDEISQAIIENLKVKLLGGKEVKLVKRYTDNLEAYSLFLKGRYYWNSLSAEGWQKSFECYQKAIEIDPKYAPAYVGLSIWYQSLAFWGDTHPGEAFSKSRELALEALKIDNNISDAHNCLAVLYWTHDRNWQMAENEFEKTLELEPTNALGQLNYGIVLSTRKQFEKAVFHARQAQRLDPLSSLVNSWAAMIFNYAGHHEEAIQQLQQIITQDPGHWQAYFILTIVYIHVNEYEEAIAAAEEAVRLSGGASVATAFLAVAYSFASRKKEATKQSEELLSRTKQKYIAPTFLVWVYISLDEIEEAYRWLKKAVEDHDPWLCWYGIGPEKGKAKDPRFEKLLKNCGLMA
ncbi:MAG: protein kinase [bacterium]